MKPKISVVAPVYGVEKYIFQFLDSIRNQNFEDFEVILVDDGSPDNCPAILDAFAAEDERYKVIHQKNGGVSAARNTGIDQANGEYIYLVDSDDWLEPTALDSLWKEAERTNADIIYGDYVHENNSIPIVRRCFPKPFVTEDMKTIEALQFSLYFNGIRVHMKRPEFERINVFGGAPWRAMFKSSLAEVYGIRFDESLRYLGEDILFWQNIYEHVTSVAYTQSLIYHYRSEGQSLCHGYKSNLLDIYEDVFRTHNTFMTEHRKGREFREAFYIRVIFYIDQAMKYYFVNIQNTDSERERYKAFKRTIAKEPYRNAIQKVPLGKFVSNKTKVKVLLLRLGLTRLFWNWCERKYN